MSNSLLKASHLSVQRGDKEVLRDVSFDIGKGEIYALLGGNGAGKSTTLLTFMGILKPSKGEISVLGKSPASDLAEVRKSIAYLPENAALYGHLTARENVSYFLSLGSPQPSAEELERAFDSVNLRAEARNQQLHTYSKGMRQKVAIALALLRNAPILMLDEPTSGLDPIAIEDFHDILIRLSERGVTTLMVTHDLYGACHVASRVGLLREGELVENFTAENNGRVDMQAVRRLFIEQEAA